MNDSTAIAVYALIPILGGGVIWFALMWRDGKAATSAGGDE